MTINFVGVPKSVHQIRSPNPPINFVGVPKSADISIGVHIERIR